MSDEITITGSYGRCFLLCPVCGGHFPTDHPGMQQLSFRAAGEDIPYAIVCSLKCAEAWGAKPKGTP